MKRLCLVVVAIAASAGATFAGGDPVAGAKSFRACQACHTATEDTNRVGPSLMGVVGRPAASAEGYRYSQAMKDFGAAGNVWDEARLTEFLARPRAFIAGTAMAFAGFRKPEDIANVIAYLANPQAAGQ